MGSQSVIWLVLNSEDTQDKANSVNAEGCKAVCDARIEAQGDMLYGSLREQARQIRKGNRIVMHQGGRKQFGRGAAHFVAAGVVEEEVRPLTSLIVQNYPTLWDVTKRWYKHWPATPIQIEDELFIKYSLRRATHYMPRPKTIRPLPKRFGGKSKFIPLHPNCAIHPECSVYAEVDAWWQRVMAEP